MGGASEHPPRLVILRHRGGAEDDPLVALVGCCSGYSCRLQRMLVGARFLASLRELDGIDLDKVLEVCAQVAAGMAHELPAREVHQLRSGPRGAASRVRASDQAQAWRCALQVNSPSARRLHWWAVPSTDGQVIEFANVGLHDDFSIPE